MALPDVRRGPRWQVWRTNCLALASDPIGQRYAVLDYQGVLTVHRMEDNQELHRFETGPVVADHYLSYTSVAFSPDGRYLAKMGDEQRPELWLLESGEPMLRDATVGLSEPTFSANRRWVALAGYREVICFDLVTGRESMRWGTPDRLHSLQFHPADMRIAVGYKDRPWVSIYDATSGREIAQLEIGDGKRMVVNWHPDGRHLAVGSTARGIQLWDVESQRRVAGLDAPADAVDFLTFHPSGNWLASWSWDGVTRLWEPTTGRQAMQIPLAANLRFSRDGRWLGFFWAGEDEAQ
jgi:WD40 repeat protein